MFKWMRAREVRYGWGQRGRWTGEQRERWTRGREVRWMGSERKMDGRTEKGGRKNRHKEGREDKEKGGRVNKEKGERVKKEKGEREDREKGSVIPWTGVKKSVLIRVLREKKFSREISANVWGHNPPSIAMNLGWYDTYRIRFRKPEATSSDLRRVQLTALAIFAVNKPCPLISTASNSGDNRWRCAPGDDRRKQTNSMDKEIDRRIASTWKKVLEFVLHSYGQEPEIAEHGADLQQLHCTCTYVRGAILVTHQQTDTKIRKMSKKNGKENTQNKPEGQSQKRRSGIEDVVRLTNRTKWHWGGHMVRIQPTRWAHTATLWDPRIGWRNRGRPRTRWRDEFKLQLGGLWTRIDAKEHGGRTQSTNFERQQQPVLIEYGGNGPDGETIKAWCEKFLAAGSVNKQSGGSRRVSEEKIEEIRAGFQRSPQKSIRHAFRQFNVPRLTVQIIQQLKPDDRPRRQTFTIEMLDCIDRNPQFLGNVLFSDEATFRVSGSVNWHNVRIRDTQIPFVYREHARDSPKVNVWCGLMNKIVGPFFFHEESITGPVYQDILEQFLYHQVADLQPQVIFQQDGAHPHWSLNIRNSLTETFPDRWIGSGRLIWWPPRSPDITPLDFFLWGYVKDRVFETSVQDLQDFRTRTRDTIATVSMNMLDRTWNEID
ncbi:hypothetical protein ANN_11458 [Periplaneta americana]|uniref:Uncharacterized protein n=1 Tax=Periplaneta americana TaxID=6978 RepID=A0ABQ8T6S0_PERAM|nr:hypothetical protein ANN_11458 [Periplaneta americana]